ncbi:hypothetical protein C5L14_07985 [Labrys okinawensis]|uniref:Uncharacterized protein n=1 Tax=Labrys okinawensis TaxID=346911 RepID=A0A2S9QES4_9HYPH|nr:hypothetical protein [Labrys okinawensis]PRH87842.1 hypothetical protein C5L14_07985 [Labrys okinawensis]
MVGSQYGVWAARSALLAGVVTPALLLGGCSSSVITGVYGTPTETAAPQQTQTASQGPLRVDFDPDTECPQINIPTGAAAYGPPSAQFSITNFARECDLASGNTVTIKIGVEGHVSVAGGGGGGYSAPVRITIRDRDEKPVYTRVIRATASATPGGGPGSFRVVDTSAPITIGLEQPLSSYDIVVGFDGKGGTVTKKKRRG